MGMSRLSRYRISSFATHMQQAERSGTLVCWAAEARANAANRESVGSRQDLKSPSGVGGWILGVG